MKKLARAGIALALGVGLATAAVQPASANSWTAFCLNNVSHNTALDSSLPNTIQWCQVQGGPAAAYAYTGPVNGVPRSNTYKGLQRYLAANYGYTGAIDGILGPQSYRAMQRAANATGWAGTQPVDGVMSQLDWQCWGYHLKVVWFGL